MAWGSRCQFGFCRTTIGRLRFLLVDGSFFSVPAVCDAGAASDAGVEDIAVAALSAAFSAVVDSDAADADFSEAVDPVAAAAVSCEAAVSGVVDSAATDSEPADGAAVAWVPS